jgi:iron complex outermembrane receptor protein
MKTTLKTLFLATTGMASMLTAFAATAAEDVESIIVTAQRRAERLQDVPITIASISSDTMRKMNVTQLSDISKVTAGVRFDARSSFITPSIRGISTNIIFAGGGSLIGVYLDGFYAPALKASDIALMNVEGVQVLKGPQGTLFGRNVTGGAILVTTTKPSSTTKAVAEVAYGSYDSQRYQGYVTTGLSDKVAADFAINYTKSNGWVKNIANGDTHVGRNHDTTLRAGVNFEVSDNFSALVRYSHESKSDPSPTLQSAYILNGEAACARCSNAGSITATRFGEIAADEPLKYVFSSDAYQLTLNWDVGFADLTSYTQYRRDRGNQHYSLDYTNTTATPAFQGLALSILDENRTTSQEFLVTSKPGSRLQWTAGLFYFDWWSEFAYVGANATPNPIPPYALSSASGARNQSYAAYGEAVYEVVDSLFVTAGLRYTHDNFKDGYYKVGAAGVPVIAPNVPTSAVTPRGIIRYQITPDSSTYVSVSKGYKAAIINVGGQSTAKVNPESLWAYEVGYKYAASGVGLNLSGYYYNYKNQQLQQSRLVNGITSTLIVNAASSKMYGIDADFHYAITDDFEVNLGGEWSHARYSNFPNAPGITITRNGAGVPIAYPTVLVNASHLPMSKAPDWSGNLGAAYTIRDAINGGQVVLSGNLYYTSKIYFDLSAQIPQKAYALLDLRAEWTDASERYSVAVSGKNVTNHHYYSQAGTNALGVGAVWAAPAIFEGSFRVKW